MTDLIITPLGTASPYCKDEKNCPGFLIESNGFKVILDCGDGISRLLNFPEVFDNLIIILSHLHKDHYSGLSSIAYASYVYNKFGLLNERIKVYVPFSYEDSVDYDYLMKYGEENFLTFKSYDINSTINHGDMDITFCNSKHAYPSYSIKVKSGDISIVYSGDTGYNYNLVKFSKDADLLICESTFLKEQQKKDDVHLYAFEAGVIAKKANVKDLLLTHFWPEIDSENYVEEAKGIFENTSAAKEGEKIVLRRELK